MFFGKRKHSAVQNHIREFYFRPKEFFDLDIFRVHHFASVIEPSHCPIQTFANIINQISWKDASQNICLLDCLSKHL